MADTMTSSLTCANLFVAFAAVTGFAEKKCGKKGVEYVFVVEVYWSDGRTTYVKRTYRDFLRFYKILQPYFKANPRIDDNGKASIPKLEGWRWFRRYNRDLAEMRELELHNFVRELLRVDQQICCNPLVIEFFEQRPTDPVPCGRARNMEERSEIFAHSNVVR